VENLKRVEAGGMLRVGDDHQHAIWLDLGSGGHGIADVARCVFVADYEQQRLADGIARLVVQADRTGHEDLDELFLSSAALLSRLVHLQERDGVLCNSSSTWFALGCGGTLVYRFV
jgi:hypothetical protein